MQDVYFGSIWRRRLKGDTGGHTEKERRIRDIEGQVLDLFDDAYCNKHLLYGVVDLIIVRLVPELAEKGIWELRDERLGD